MLFKFRLRLYVCMYEWMSIVIPTLCGLSVYSSTSNSPYRICKIVHFQIIQVFKKKKPKTCSAIDNEHIVRIANSTHSDIVLIQISLLARPASIIFHLLHSKYACELDIYRKLCLLLPSYDWLTNLSGFKVGSHCDRLFSVNVDHSIWFQLVYFKTSSAPDHKNTNTKFM
jgi:hypothetical protein